MNHASGRPNVNNQFVRCNEVVKSKVHAQRDFTAPQTCIRTEFQLLQEILSLARTEPEHTSRWLMIGS